LTANFIKIHLFKCKAKVKAHFC